MQPAEVDKWLNFFTALAGASVAFLAIAFITFQLRYYVWREDKLLHIVAIRTLAEFLLPFFFSLITLVPPHNWRFAGVLVGIVGLSIDFTHLGLYQRAKVMRHPLDDFDRRQATGTVFIGLAVYGVLLLPLPLLWDVGVLIWSLLPGSIETWIFLHPRGISPQRRRKF